MKSKDRSKALEDAKKHLKVLRDFKGEIAQGGRCIDKIYQISKKYGFSLKEMGTSDGELAMYGRKQRKRLVGLFS